MLVCLLTMMVFFGKTNFGRDLELPDPDESDSGVPAFLLCLTPDPGDPLASLFSSSSTLLFGSILCFLFYEKYFKFKLINRSNLDFRVLFSRLTVFYSQIGGIGAQQSKTRFLEEQHQHRRRRESQM